MNALFFVLFSQYSISVAILWFWCCEREKRTIKWDMEVEDGAKKEMWGSGERGREIQRVESKSYGHSQQNSRNVLCSKHNISKVHRLVAIARRWTQDAYYYR